MLVSFLPDNWQDLAAETGALKGLRKNKSAENLLRVLLLHLVAGTRCWRRCPGPAGGTGRTVLGGAVESAPEVTGVAALTVPGTVSGARLGIVRSRGLAGAGAGCHDGQGAGQNGVAVARALQRSAAVAGLRLLPADRDGRDWHGGELHTVPNQGRRLPAGGPGLLDGAGPAACGAGGRAGDRACEYGLAGVSKRPTNSRLICWRRWGHCGVLVGSALGMSG